MFKRKFFVVALLIFSVIFSSFYVWAENDAEYIYVLSKSDKELASSFFDDEDIAAIYDDGAVLAISNDRVKNIIKNEELPIDLSLTSPEQYSSKFGNDALVKDFFEKTKGLSGFENKSEESLGFYIIQFIGPIKQEWIDSIVKSTNSVIFLPVPPYSYLVWGLDLKSKLENNKVVRNVQSVNSVSKLSSNLINKIQVLETENKDTYTSNVVNLAILIADFEKDKIKNITDSLKKTINIGERLIYKSSVASYCVWEIETLVKNIPILANVPEVFYIEPIEPAKLCGERELIIDTGQFDATGDAPLPGASYERWLAGKKINGAGAVVQVVDTGLDRGNSTNQPGTVHTDILGRVAGIVDYSGDNNGIDNYGHGTLNAGIIAGNPFTRLKDPDGYLVGMGVAPKSKIFATKVSNSTNFYFKESLTFITQDARSYGASISLQPWGRNLRTFDSMTGEFSDPPAYSSQAAEFDSLTRVANGDNINPLSMLFIVSAGNEGWFCDMFSCYLVEKSITNPAIAKNIISVGSFTGCPPEGGKRRDPEQSTSRGPTADGRIAPTIITPGVGITGIASQSEKYQNGSPIFYPAGQTLYTRGNGTSHAAAQVAGAAALYTDWWQRFHNYESTPSPAMIKAAIINSTEDMQGGTYPVEIPSSLFGFGEPIYETVDYAPEKNQGWGGLNLNKLIPDPGKEINQIYLDQKNTKTFDANGQTWETIVYSVSQDTPLNITLVWTDPAAAANASKALVNDLDLTVINGAGQVLIGNALKKGWTYIGGSADRVNNVEVVKVKNPYGAFTVRVRAASLTGKILPNDTKNKQDFAIAISGATIASKKGFISFAAKYAKCSSKLGIILADIDLAKQNTYTVNVKNVTLNQNVDVQLTENPPNSGVFRGEVELVASPEAFKLVANHGDTLSVEYNDVDDGSGNPAKVTTTAQMDCTNPQVTNFIVSNQTAFSTNINISLSKAASGIMKWGTSTTNLNNSYILEDISLNHSITIAGLNPCSIYYTKFDLVDAVGNAYTDNNNGNYYSFQTLEDEPSFLDDSDLNYNQNNFTHAAIQGTDDWTRIDDTNNSYSPTHAYRTQAVPSVKDIYLKTKNVGIKPNSRLTFYHKFKLEPGFDGAVAEISTDNGVRWKDLGQYIVEGKYNAMIALFSGNPLMARLAWTYVWEGGKVEFRRSWIDLDKFRGKTAQIRFRLATDDSIILPDSAWYVDNVKISYDSDCANTLYVKLDKWNYGPTSPFNKVHIRVLDPTLQSAVSVNVKVESNTEQTSEIVSCTKTADYVYEGDIYVKDGLPVGGDNFVSCTDNDVITVKYKSSDNGGTSNPDQANAYAFYYLPQLIFAPPQNEGVTKFYNDIQNAMVFPFELSALGADIFVDSIKVKQTIDSQLDPPRDIPPNGIKIYEDSNEDKTFNNGDLLIGEASYDPATGAIFSNLNYKVTRDSLPRIFILVSFTDKVPFGTRFQFEIANLTTDMICKLQDGTPIIPKSNKPAQGLAGKIISRALLVNQNAPTIYLEDGETWITAYHTIGDVLAEAKNRASRSKTPIEIWVARGRYMEFLLDPYGKALVSNVELYGGFGGDETNKVEPRKYILETMIERPHKGEAQEYDDQYYYQIDMYGGAVLDGFHLFADHNMDYRPWSWDYPESGGILLKYNDGKGVQIRNCIFRNFRQVAIHANNGANTCPNSKIINCVFAWLRDAPVWDLGYGTQFINCSFYDVSGWDIRGRQYYFTNCAWDWEVPNNCEWTPQWALRADADDYNRVRNCIFGAGVEGDVNIYGDFRGNIKAKPKYINPNFIDFRLAPDSPAIDKGTVYDPTNPAMVLDTLDIRGNNRVIGDAPDLGACEFVPNKEIYYIKNIKFGDEGDPEPIIFRPDKPVNIRFTIGSYNQPGDLVTLGGRISMNDRHFKIERNLGLFAPETIGVLKQVDTLPFSATLTGTPGAFYNVKLFLDFLKTDGSNEVLDTSFIQFSMPAFVDPVNGEDPREQPYLVNDDNHAFGGIKKPFKTPWPAALFYMYPKHYGENPTILIAEGTVNQYINYNSNSWHTYFAKKIEFYGGFNPRTWERDPNVFKTIWTGENQRPIIRMYLGCALKVDGFTIKDATDNAISIDNYPSDWYYGNNEFTNNIFQNNNGSSIIYLYQNYATYHRTYDAYWSDIGAPLVNAGTINGSVLSSWLNTSNLSVTDFKTELSEFTVEAWIYPRSYNKYNCSWPYYRTGNILILENNNNHTIRMHTDQDGKAWIFVDMPDWPYQMEMKSPNPIEKGKWTHVALTVKKDPQEPKKHYGFLYINGEVVNNWISTMPSSFNIKNPSTFYIASIDGNADEIRIWNTALPADKILENRDKEISNAPNLVSAWHFNEIQGTKTYSADGLYSAGVLHRYRDINPTNKIQNNTFINNKATGIYIYYHAMPTLIDKNIFKGNEERILYTHEHCPFMQISNNVINSNSVPNENYLFQINYPHNHFIINNTIINNNAKVIQSNFDSCGKYFGVDSIVNNIIWNNVGTTTDSGVSGRFVYNLLKIGDQSDSIINPDWAKNLFCTPAFDSDGFHLLSNSCARQNGPQIMNVKTFKAAAEIPYPYIYCDNSDSNYAIWGDGLYSNWGGYGSYNGNFNVIYRSSITSQWRFPSIPEGKWEVFVYIPNYNGFANIDVQYFINHKNGETVVNLNQNKIYNQWYSLGMYDFNGNGSVALYVGNLPSGYVASDAVYLKYFTEVSQPGTTAPPSAAIMMNFWDIDTDIDGQSRPTAAKWDIGADQYFAGGDPQGPVVKATLVSGSLRLAGIPFTVGLNLQRNYDNAPAGFRFRIQYPAGAITNLTAVSGSLGATPTLGNEIDAGNGKVYRELTAIPGNTANTLRNTQLVKLNFTVADPYPSSLTIDILPPTSGSTVVDASGNTINAFIDGSLLSSLRILSPNPISNFTAVPTRGLVNPEVPLTLTVYFQDASLGYITSWIWDFGDGTPTDNRKNPSHEYINPGTYTVSLTVQGPYGKSTKVRTDYIVASDPREAPTANFTADPFNTANQRVEGPAPLKVEFLDATNGPTSTFAWDFGDGATDTAQNPTHIYQNPGDYTVKFDVDGPMGPDSITKTNYIHVTAPEPIQANFVVDNPLGFAPHTVNFTNASSGQSIQFFYYDFGDGKWSQESNTAHEYILPGQYNSRLTIAGATGFSISDPKQIKVQQAFPIKQLNNVLLGITPKTQDLINALDFNKDGNLDIADLIYYINNYKK